MNTYDDIIAALNGEYIPKRYRNITKQMEEALNFINQDRKDIQRKIAKAKAELLPYSRLGAKAVAGQADELRLPIELTIVPLGVSNGNRQGIPQSEADNIIATAKHMPIGANFDGTDLLGHTGAEDVGVITDVFNTDNVITARGFIWKERNQDLVDYLQERKEVGSSFEVYYTASYDHNGVQWLQGVIFARHTLVSNPSYGQLTPVRLTL